MQTLSPAEIKVARSLLVKQFGPETVFLEQLAVAAVSAREMTGTGYYAFLAIPPRIPKGEHLNGDASDGYSTSLAAPCDFVGFTIFIRDGYLSWLEGYTFGDVKWPDEPIENWLLFDAAPAPQRAK